MAKTRSEIQAKYDKENTKIFSIKLNNKTDKDILEYLASVPNRQGYIKQLIRKDMEQSVPNSAPNLVLDDCIQKPSNVMFVNGKSAPVSKK